MCNSRSDIGAKAAWKGFSSQTTYIAYRLMNLDDKYDFYPEKVEDLMIRRGDSIIELVQIKNLSGKLTLSSFSPKESDSFFRRALANRKDNHDFILKIISFGDIGDELQGFLDNDKIYKNNIKTKLLQYKYAEEDIAWIFSNLSIEQVNEENLKGNILRILENKIETMSAPQIAFDTLITYVSDLSRYSKYTSKEKWYKKIDDFVHDIVSIKGMCDQYGRTIVNLADYNTQKSNEKLAYEYELGVNAHPQHIRNNLDIIRDKWLDRIEDSFKNDNNIVIMKGASGQGKSSLAYRYLINNYLENYVFVVEKVVDSQQAIDIVAALNGLSISRQGNIIVYMDVQSYDKEWLWIAEEISKRGVRIKLFITMREEDFNRSDIDLDKIRLKMIELSFGESEAKKIFEKYNSPYFLNFEQAWEKFGEKGPFMEFMYMLNQSDTLKNKLEVQISKITSNEVNADEWLSILQVICYVSKNNLKINLYRLLNELSCNQTRKMLKQFEDEYLIKISIDNKYVECLHAVRAEILYDILIKDSMMDEETTLIYSLNVVEEFCQSMLVQYFFKHSNIDDFITRLSKNKLNSWTSCSSILSGLLWLDTYRFYLKNKEVIIQGNKVASDNFLMLTGDSTGYLDFDSSEIISSIATIYPDKGKELNKLVTSLPQQNIDYRYTSIFISNIKEQLSKLSVIPSDNLSEISFVLFWLEKRNIFLEDVSYQNVVENLSEYTIDSLLDFLIGIQVQNRIEVYNDITEYLTPIICKRYNIVRLKCNINSIEADFIQNVTDESSENSNINMNERVMTIVLVLRRLFLKKQQYKVKAIGTDIIEDIEMPDTYKNINSRNLPLVWITQMNGWIIKIDDYQKRTDNWDDFRWSVNNSRKSIFDFSKMVCEAVGYFYKKGGSIEKFNSQEFNEKYREMVKLSTQIYKTPKCVNDKYGLIISKNKVNLTDVIKNNNAEESEKDITQYMNKYKTSFTNFTNQMLNMVIARYKNSCLDETSRLPTINIVASVSDLVNMQKKYSEVFSSCDDIINTKEEYEELLLLSVVWSYLYTNKVRKESSVLYECKEKIKQTRKKMRNFFTCIIRDYTSKEVIRINSQIYIPLDGALIDNFCEKLFSQFKEEFPNIEALSIESLFLEDFAKEIILTVSYSGDLIIAGVKIKLNNLIYCNNIEKFMLYRQPLDRSDIDSMNNNYYDEENINFNSYKVIGNLQALTLFYNHTTSVMKYIKSLSKDTIVEANVFNNWHENCYKFNIKVIEEIINSLRKLENNISCESYDDYEEILTLLNDYKEISESIVLKDNKEQINCFLNSIIEKTICLLHSLNLI